MPLLSLLAVLLSVTPSFTEVDVKCVSPSCVDAAAEILSTLDRTVDPCEDFYEYACGNFANTHPMPPGQILWDYWMILQEQMDNISKSILEDGIAPNDTEAVKKAKEMYAACMDIEALDKRGLEPLVQLLEKWGGWPVLDPQWADTSPNWNKMADILAEYAVPFMLSFDSRANLDNANITALYLGNPSFGLPSPLLKLGEEPDFLKDFREGKANVRETPFIKFIVKVGTSLRDYLQLNVSDDTIMNEMVDTLYFMQNLSKANTKLDLNREDMYESVRYSKTVEELQQDTDKKVNTSIVWLDFFNHAGANVTLETPVIVTGDAISFIKQIEDASPRLVWNYVFTRLLTFLSPESSKDAREAFLDFYVQMGYIPEDYPRSTYCLHKTVDYPNIGFSHAIAYKYRYTRFHPKKLEEAKEMTNDLMDGFLQLLSENVWMDEDTESKAAEKADAMLVLSGFPTWTDTGAQLDEFYSEMAVSRDDHFGNVARLRPFMQLKNLATLGKPRERNEWTQSPLVVNAFYNSLNNRIIFPVAMMGDPFFSGDERERCLDYGRIGAMVGHEITHGFDSNGRNYDEFGSASDWFSDEAEVKFKERQQCFIEQYNKYVITAINATVNGNITLKENIADNGGVREAYRAFKTLHERESGLTTPRLPGLEWLTPDQLFFIGFATMWCRAETPEGLSAMLNDGHSPYRFRVIGSLSNMQEFSDVFNCPAGSKMNPENKCLLW